MTENIWDDPSLIDATDFYKFLVVGDTAAGVIQSVGRKEWPPTPPSTTPKIDAELVLIDDVTGEEKTLTVGTVRLKEAFIAEQPGAGDHVSVTLKRIEPRGGGKSMKHYDVKITKAEGGATTAPAPVAAPVAAEPVAAVAQAAADPSAAQAALEALRVSDPATYALLHPQAAAQA